MSETGRTYGQRFKGLAIEAVEVRAWTTKRTTHPDAAAVANELFVAVLQSGAETVEVTLSTAGDRLRITATGTEPLSVQHSHGPGRHLVSGLAHATGLTTDERGLWAQLNYDRREGADT